MPAKFLVGSRRPARSARPPARHISSQNVTSAQNYGIVKAGDGGNGGISASAALTKDSTIDNYAPGSAASGSQKNEGKNNGSVVFYKKGEKNYEFQANDTQPLVSNSGIAGYDGNSSWGGMYLVKNYEKWDKKSYVKKLDHEFKSIRKFEYIHYNYGISNGKLEQTGVGAKITKQKKVEVDNYNRLVISTGEVKVGWGIEGYYSNENVLYYVNITVDYGADTITIRKGSWIDGYAINQPTNAVCNGFEIKK